MRHYDVHQHLWPPEFIEALRARTQPPLLRGWTLHTATEAPFDIDAADHDVELRCQAERGAEHSAERGAEHGAEHGAERVLVSLSSPLGIEDLPPHEAQPLLDAWHAGAAGLPEPFRAWASLSRDEPDLDGFKTLIVDHDFAGLQLPAIALATPAALASVAPVLRRCEELDRPVLIHPGPATPASGAPPWWPAVVAYSAQLQAAWWAWRAEGRRLLPGLRICFVAGAGLAPLQVERYAVRSGQRFIVDRDAFVETSSHGRQALDALTRVLGIDALVLGSDRPYAPLTLDHHLGDAARHAFTVTNPIRLLEGDPS